MKFIKEHMTSIIVSIVILFLIVLIFIAIYSMFNPSNSKSNPRLDNEVIIQDSEVEKIKAELNNSGIINNVSYNKNIRILKFIVNVKDDTKLEDSYKLGDIILNNFNKEILSYYDVELYITSNTDSYPIIGYHSKSADKFTWTINRGEVSE